MASDRPPIGYTSLSMEPATRSFAVLSLSLVLLLAGACAAPPPGPAVAAGGETGGDPEPAAGSRRVLRQALDAVWDKTLEESLYLRLQEGLPVETLPEVSHVEALEDAAFARELLDRLEAVEAGELTYPESLDLAILRRQLEAAVEEPRCFWLTFPVTPYTSPLPLVHRVFTEAAFAGAGDLERYLDLLEQYQRLVGQIEAHLRQQEEKGIRLPRPELELVVPMIRGWVQEPEASLFAVVPERLAAADAEAAAAFQADVAEAVRRRIHPALEGLAAYLDGDYRRQAPETVGLWQYPGGEGCYRSRVRQLTSLDVPPERVHEIGLAEMARIDAQMSELRRSLGFTGTRADFHQALRDDPRFRPDGARAIGDRLRGYVAEIEPRIDELFRLIPQAPYDVARLDPSLEGGMTYGYYRPPTGADPRGLYFYNGSQPDKRSLIWAQALIYHELVPGHHFQIALQQENASLHPLRRQSFPTAFIEGWAEYASSLGEELGLYDDPYDLYGRYAHEMFLAVRLVVDTGMHRFRWSRQRAMETMAEHTLESNVQIATETLRYGVDMPAQALAYKLGAIEIWRLRREAEAALGEAFDLRDFHAAVLGSGAMPLTVLAGHVDHFIAEARAGRKGGRTTPAGR